jgi:hypothetical protein
MAESIGPEPIPVYSLRMFAVAELTTIQSLLVYLGIDGLQFVRTRLRSPDLVHVCDEGPLAETRAVLLDTTCRALVAFEWATEKYFLQCGDMLPDAPDTIEDDFAVPLDWPTTGEVVDEPPQGATSEPHTAPEDLTELDDDH